MEALRNRWIRLPFLFGFGLIVAALAGRWASPRWVDYCTRVKDTGVRCEPIDIWTMTGYITIGLGIVVMIIGPIVASLIHLFAHGYNWETSRVETLVSNLPIAAGIAYFVLGFVIAAAA
jgi:hypothetical protein